MAVRGLRGVYMEGPSVFEVEHPSQRERNLYAYGDESTYSRNIAQRYFSLKEILDSSEKATPSTMLRLYANRPINIKYTEYKENGSREIYHSSDACNILGSERVTVDAPEQYDNTIWIIGSCYTSGTYTDDANTLASLIQQRVNTCAQRRKKYRAASYYIRFFTVWEVLEFLEARGLSRGDIIVYIGPHHKAFSAKTTQLLETYSQQQNISTLRYVNLVPLFQRPHDLGEVFIDCLHVDKKGMRAIADRIYTEIEDWTKAEQDVATTSASRTTPIVMSHAKPDEVKLLSNEFNQYLHDLEQTAQKHPLDQIGAIVVNCNPFTLGHRYLIDSAASQVDFLYIFVVSEDKSHFRFEDRLKMVKEGTKDISNIEILPSGKYIISNLTFSDYFSKEQVKEIADPVFDVELFAKYIAPALNIKTRFVGTEPQCAVTNAYNRTMKKILPIHGVQLVVIERKTTGGEAISASTVRMLLEKKDFVGMVDFVPATTLSFLQTYYG